MGLSHISNTGEKLQAMKRILKTTFRWECIDIAFKSLACHRNRLPWLTAMGSSKHPHLRSLTRQKMESYIMPFFMMSSNLTRWLPCCVFDGKRCLPMAEFSRWNRVRRFMSLSLTHVRLDRTTAISWLCEKWSCSLDLSIWKVPRNRMLLYTKVSFLAALWRKFIVSGDSFMAWNLPFTSFTIGVEIYAVSWKKSVEDAPEKPFRWEIWAIYWLRERVHVLKKEGNGTKIPE